MKIGFFFVIVFAIACLTACGDSSTTGSAVSNDRVVHYPSIEVEGHVDRPPVFQRYVVPEYPRLAQQAAIEGAVRLRTLIGTDGVVKQVEILDAGNFPGFAYSAWHAALANHFRPALVNHHPVAAWISYTVEFRLPGN